MSADLMATARLSWSKVAEECTRRLGRKYSGAYCREVATGFRNSRTLTPILRELGVLSAVVEAAVLVESRGRLLFQRRTLARHLLDALRESRALRAELEESQSRAAATALRLGNELAEKSTDIDILRNHIAAVTSDRNALRERLDEAQRTNDRLIARLSKQSRTRRVTHIRIGNELFRNRTGARA